MRRGGRVDGSSVVQVGEAGGLYESDTVGSLEVGTRMVEST